MLDQRRAALDRIRAAKRRRTDAWAPDDAELSAGDAPVDPALAVEHARVSAALALLPQEQRAVVELAYFDGFTTAEIAERAAIPVGTVKSRMSSARAKLRELLGGRASSAETPGTKQT